MLISKHVTMMGILGSLFGARITSDDARLTESIRSTSVPHLRLQLLELVKNEVYALAELANFAVIPILVRHEVEKVKVHVTAGVGWVSGERGDRA